MTFQTIDLAKCDQCTMITRPRIQWKVPASPELPILWVGQAPGEVEAITGIPFSGPAGKMLGSLMRMAGFNKFYSAMTNACSCYPEGDAKPTALEIHSCHPRLKEEIHLLQPQLIVALGDTAMEALIGQSGAKRLRGSFHPLMPSFDYECQVLCCLHPSFIMRQRQWIPVAVEDLKKAKEYLMGNILLTTKDPVFINEPTEGELRDYLYPTLVGDEVIAFDTETTGLNTRLDTVIGFSLSRDPGSALAFDLKPNDPRLGIMKMWLEDETQPKVTQNGSYDCEIIKNSLGFDVRGLVFDTRLAEQMLHSDLPTDLDFLRAQYTGIKPYKPPKAEIKIIKSWGKERRLLYANWDAVTTKAVMEAQLKRMPKVQLDLLQSLLIPLVYAINTMERRGVRADTQAMGAIYSQCFPILHEMEQKFAEIGLNPRSPKQITSFFDLKSSDEDELIHQINRRHPQREWMRSLLEYRKYNKIASVYIKGMYGRLEDGRIHTHYKIDGTGTGRLSSEDPALQNVPRELRSIFIPDGEDFVFVESDYKAVELWVLAVLSGDEDLMKDLLDGRDVHGEMARIIYNLNPGEPYTDDQKLVAKTVVFGTAYGRTPPSISRQFGVPQSTASQWQDICVNRYPRIAEYRDRCTQEFSSQGYLETPFGRRRYVERVTQGYNFPVQSSASDITLTTLVELHQAGFDLRLTVHDSIVFQVRRDQLEEMVLKAKKIIQRPIQALQNLSFRAEYKWGSNWYEMEKMK